MLPQVKVYEIDWEFITSNYLDPSMWQKRWHLFVYKDFVVDCYLSQIDCKDNSVWIRVVCNKMDWDLESVNYYVGKTPLPNLKRQIQSAIWRIVETYEKKCIRKTTEYLNIKSTANDEENRLQEIAESFLDDNNVTNKEIRKAYIDSYVSNNTKVDTILNQYVNSKRYTVCSELMLMLAAATNDDDRISMISRACNNPDILTQVLDDYNNAKAELENEEEYFKTYSDALESI